MDDVTVARALHVLSIVLWIGGVGFVTTVLLPSVRRLKAPHERIGFFDAVERRFAWQARIWMVLAGLTGLYMLARLDLWDRFRYAAYWWMHAMIAVWLLFTVVLFVAEPLFLHRWLLARAKAKPKQLSSCWNGCTGSGSSSVWSPLPARSPAPTVCCCSNDRQARRKRGRSLHWFFNALNREPGDPASPRSCFRGASWGMAGESPRRRDTSASPTV